MDRKEVYNEIYNAFSKKYSWLGEQFAEEFLLSIASYNIQTYSSVDFRVRRHPLLFWSAGFGKSSLLKRAYEILGPGLCIMMSDVTQAALRGTVNNGVFISPFTLKKPFAVCTEFGQIVGGANNTDMVQSLLNILEEGIVTVSLAKISSLPMDSIKGLQDDYNIRFTDNNTFTYNTNWVLMAGTYNRKFLVDNAFQSRFVMVTPEKKLDSELIKHIHNSGPFVLSQDCLDTLRAEVMNPTPIDCMYKLPDEVYTYNLTMRDMGSILSSLLCKRWWGFEPTKEDAIALAERITKANENVWKSGTDKVFDALESEEKSVDELVADTGLSKRAVYNALKELRSVRVGPFEDGKIKHRIM